MMSHALDQDLENVLGSTEIATLFLDRSLRIQRFTPALTQFLNILHADIGRPIAHLNLTLDYGQLVEDARQVLDSLTVVDREVRGEKGDWFLARIRPYRTAEDKIDGVVVTFVNITPLKKAETALRQLNETLESRVEERTRALEETNRRLEQTGNMFSMLFHANPIPTSLTRLADGLFLDANEAYCNFFGLPREQIVDHSSRELKLPFQAPLRSDILSRLRQQEFIADLELEVRLRSGEARTALAYLQRLTVDGTDAILATFVDITGRVRAERQIRTLAASLTAAEQKERHRISQILHDDLQQRLFAVKMQLSFLEQAYRQGNAQGIEEDTANLENWLSDSIETTRRLSVDLSPVILRGSSLTDALGWLADEVRERYGMEVDVHASGDIPRLDDHIRILLFESVRELLFNIVKHGEIKQANVTLEPVDSRLRVQIIDHGKGFDAEAVLADPKAAHGLLDIRNRLNLLGCSMQVVSHPADGTQVTIEVPT